ncbi:MAG: CARDB domain-containing protein, partial [Candidatus Syntropharchaeales archaeon]
MRRLVAVFLISLFIFPLVSADLRKDLSDSLPLGVRSPSDAETLVCGYLFYRGTTGSVEIRNFNKSLSWNARILDSNPDFYYLYLNSSELQAGDTIRIDATSGGERVAFNHTVSESEIASHILWLDLIEDLAIIDVVMPDQVIKGENNTITATIENIGMVPVVDPFKITFLVDGEFSNSTTFTESTLNHGDNFTVTFNWVPGEEELYRITISADPEDSVIEANDANNIFESNAEVVKPFLPDLTITTIATPTLYLNRTCRINSTILNHGRSDINTSFNVSLKADGELIGSEVIAKLSTDKPKTISFSWTPTESGRYRLVGIADPGDDVEELDEGNNRLEVEVDVWQNVIYVPTDYQTVQEAIDNATTWSVIYLEDGEYPANKNSLIKIINKSHLWIKGSDEVMVILESDSQQYLEAMKIKDSSHIILSGFTVRVVHDARMGRNILIDGSNNITLENLTLINNAPNYGNSPLVILDSEWCKIKGCTFKSDNSGYGIYMLDSNRYLIENNTLLDLQHSIYMGNTTNSTLCKNRINTIWVGGEDDTIWPNIYRYCNRNTIHDNEISMLTFYGDDNTIHNNIIHSLSGDKTKEHCEGENNTFYLNNIFDIGVVGIRGENNWNSTAPVSYTYNGTTRTNHTGNFWFDYSGIDNNSNGIGDVPYKVCDGNYDYYPLVEPYGLTFDLAVTAITRPCKIYADRTNTILITIERDGTYPTPEDVIVNLMVNDTGVDSKTVRIGPGANIVRLTWTPLSVGDYKLGVEVHPEKTLISEMNDTNNRFEIDLTVSSPLFDYTDNISSALEFLRNEQLATGAIWNFENSARAALSIISAGENPSAWRLIDYLRDEPERIAKMGMDPVKVIREADLARMVMVISAIGQDPTNFGGVNYLTMLKSYHDGEQFGERDDVKDDAFAILALVASGNKDLRTKDMITKTIGYIKARQNDDGGWGSFSVESDVRTTSLVIQALIAAGEDKNSETITKALDYLRKAQAGDGGYSDVIDTSYAIQAFIAAGEAPSNYSNTIEYLLSLQQLDGSFNYTTDMSFFPPRMTIFPVFALCGEPYPVMLKTTKKSYELPDVSVRDVVTDDEITVNTSCTVRAEIKSNGGIFYADLLADGEFVARKRVCSVWHDSLTPVSFTWKPDTTGPHNLTIFADSMDNITESNEGNNNVTIEVNVTLPDLYP